MEQLNIPRILISGPTDGVGKSLISLGLTMALRKRAVSVSCAVVGANIPLAVLLKRFSGRNVRCLDGMLLASNQIVSSSYHASVGAELLLMVGHGGLFCSSKPGAIRGSDAEVAMFTKTPVVFVVDTRKIGSSIAALVKGYSDFHKDINVAGVIANFIESKLDDYGELMNRSFYDGSLQAAKLDKLLGAVTEIKEDFTIPKDLITFESNRTLLQRQFVIELGNIIEKNVDLDLLLKKAKEAKFMDLPHLTFEPTQKKVKIAVSDDGCFDSCFQDNLDWLRYYGAEIIPFSPLTDLNLPKKIGAVYITGAHLKDYAEELSRNVSMLEDINNFVAKKGVIYSEGSGTAYLCKKYSFADGGESFQGVGLIPQDACQVSGAFRYIDAITSEHSILGRNGLIVRGVTNSLWKLEGEPKSTLVTFKISAPGITSYSEGYSSTGQSLATFSYLHFGSNPEVAKNIVEAAVLTAG